jgi:RNA polymerase sigma-70 factor (ECF subfamily)
MLEASEDSDEDCMLRYADGELDAFRLLYERHRGGLYRYILRQTPPDVTEELYQDVWTRVIQARRRYRPDATFRTWLYTLARKRLIDWWRRDGRDPLAFARDAAAVPADAGALHPGRAADLRGCGERLLQLVESLPPAQREAFLLRYEADMTLAEIAATLDSGTETVKNRLRAALQRLHAGLPGECLEERGNA